MGNDAQVEIPTHTKEQNVARTKEACIVNRTIKTLNYKVHIMVNNSENV